MLAQLFQHCAAYRASVCSAACTVALETQYWSDPFITATHCSIAIEPSTKTRPKRSQTPTCFAFILLRYFRSRCIRAQYAPWVVLLKTSLCADFHQKQRLLWWPWWLFWESSQRDNLFTPVKHCLENQTCSDMSEGADNRGKNVRYLYCRSPENHGNAVSVVSTLRTLIFQSLDSDGLSCVLVSLSVNITWTEEGEETLQQDCRFSPRKSFCKNIG